MRRPIAILLRYAALRREDRLVYRGTAPESLITWLADLQVDPEQITIHFREQVVSSSVHRGFYRNARATGLEVVAGLQRR